MKLPNALLIEESRHLGWCTGTFLPSNFARVSLTGNEMPAFEASRRTSWIRPHATASSRRLNVFVMLEWPARLTCTCHLFPRLRMLAMSNTPCVWQGCGKTALHRPSKNKNLKKILVAEEGLEPPTRGL